VSLAAAVLLSSAFVAATSLGSGLIDARPSRPATHAPPATHDHPVRVVDTRQRIDVGQGFTIRLISDALVVEKPQRAGGKASNWQLNVLDNAGAAKPIEAHLVPGPTGILYVGWYRGSARLARVNVRIQGGDLAANIITLPGSPGWAAFYVNVRAGDAPRRTDLACTVTGYAENDTILAQTDISPAQAHEDTKRAEALDQVGSGGGT
jgi:hypothetical protein